MTSRWIQGPWWDGFFLLSGLWLAPLLLLANDVAVVSLVLTLAFWIGHRLSSAYLAWCTSSFRPLLTAQRTRFVWVPLAIVVVVCAWLLPGDGLSPWSRGQRLLALVLVDGLLVTWHFASQHYGVLALYRLRAGAPRDARARVVDRAFALGVGGVAVVVFEAAAGLGFVADLWPGLLADNAGALLDGLRLPGSVAVGAATAAVFVVDRAAVTAPRALYLLSVSFVVLSALWLPPPVFLALWTAQHWLVALGLATVVAAGDTGPDTGPGTSRWYHAWHQVNRRPALLFALLVVASVALFPFFEVEAAGDAGLAIADLQPLVLALASSWAAPLLVALGFATAFVHYQLDRAVFRFSDPAVRQATSVLLDRKHARG